MKKIKVTLLLLPLLLAGCFQVDQVVTVGPDGSGTVEETFLISRKIAESMVALVDGLGAQEETAGNSVPEKKQEPAEQPSFFKEEDIRKRAEKMGPGVSFVSMKRIVNREFEGYRAEYAFRDINRLRLDQESGGPSQRGGAGAGAKQTGTSFAFTPGKSATLVVKQQQKRAVGENETNEPKGGDLAAPVKQAGPEELAMLRQTLSGLRFSITVVVKGKIVETNATHRDGSRVTLAEIDLGQMLDKPELLATLAEIPPGDSAAALEMLKKIPGMKVDMNDELRISFR